MYMDCYSKVNNQGRGRVTARWGGQQGDERTAGREGQQRVKRTKVEYAIFGGGAILFNRNRALGVSEVSSHPEISLCRLGRAGVTNILCLKVQNHAEMYES